MLTGELRDYESNLAYFLKDKYHSSRLIWKYNENKLKLVRSRCRPLKHSARTVSLWGTCTKTGPVERNGAYKRSRLRSLPKRWTALPLPLPTSLLPSLSFPISLSVSPCRALVSRSDRPSSFDRRHKTASPVCSRLKSFSRHPLIKFRNRSSLFPSSLSAITRKSSTA